jgi:hypothetical protein
MQNPEQHRQPESEDTVPPLVDSRKANSREEDEDFREWVALVVLLACWLAEAYM